MVTELNQTYVDWVLSGYRVCQDAKPVSYRKEDNEPLFAPEDVYLDDEDL